MPQVFAYSNPTISIVVGRSIQVAARCDERVSFVQVANITTLDRAGDQVLIFLKDGSIVQLYDLPNVADTFDLLKSAL